MLRANHNIHCHTFRLANVRIGALLLPPRLGAITVVRSPAVVVPRCVPVPLLLPRVYHPGVPGTPRAHGALRGGIALIPIRCVCVCPSMCHAVCNWCACESALVHRCASG